MSYTKQQVAAKRDADVKAKQLKHALVMRALYDPTNKNKQKDAKRGFANLKVALRANSDGTFTMNRSR